METILPLLIQVIAGGIGGNGVAQAMKKASLGTMGNTIIGAIGGLVGAALTGAVAGPDTLVGLGLAGDGISGLVGGGVLTAIVGVVKNMMAKNAEK